MHTLHTNPRILHIYLPWLASALAAALELEGVHRLRRAMWGVHPIPAGMGWLLLIGLGMGGAWALADALIYLCHTLHTHALGYWLPWAIYLIYMFIVAERERRTQRLERPAINPEDL